MGKLKVMHTKGKDACGGLALYWVGPKPQEDMVITADCIQWPGGDMAEAEQVMKCNNCGCPVSLIIVGDDLIAIDTGQVWELP